MTPGGEGGLWGGVALTGPGPQSSLRSLTSPSGTSRACPFYVAREVLLRRRQAPPAFSCVDAGHRGPGLVSVSGGSARLVPRTHRGRAASQATAVEAEGGRPQESERLLCVVFRFA